MNDRAAAFLEKAHRALDTAAAVLERGDVEAAINRAYYAAFYAALAALLAAGESPKTHKGTLRRFEWHYIRTRRLPVAVAQVFRVAFDARQRSDYEAFTIFEQAAAADLIADVKRFVEAVTEMLDA